MKNMIAAIAACLLLVGLVGCTPQKPKMQVSPAKLTEQEQDIAGLLNTAQSYNLFDFAVDDSIQSVHFKRYHLENGSWQSSGGGSHAFNGEAGRIALSINDSNVRIALQSETGTSASTYTLPDEDIARTSSAASLLSNEVEIVYEKEIPLSIQIFTDKNEILSYDVSFFDSPEAYAKQGYEAVYAITATFSQQPLS